MSSTSFLRNKIKRQINWNGQNFKFVRFKKNQYRELTEEVEREFYFKGVFHEGGGYGGMLNFELYERDGARTLSRLKPMILCLYEDGRELIIDDQVRIGDEDFKVVEINDVKNLGVAIEISMEVMGRKDGSKG